MLLLTYTFTYIFMAGQGMTTKQKDLKSGQNIILTNNSDPKYKSGSKAMLIPNPSLEQKFTNFRIVDKTGTKDQIRTNNDFR